MEKKHKEGMEKLREKKGHTLQSGCCPNGLHSRPFRSCLWKRNFKTIHFGVGQLLPQQSTVRKHAASVCSSSSNGQDMTERLWSLYSETKRQTEDLIPVIFTNSVNPDTIFANNEMSLRDIEIYGFDYDYTLAFYSSHLHTLIFNIARDILITKHRYPEGLRKGLHPVPDEEVIAMDRGMSYIVGKDWRDLFDVVIVQADKPGFFNDRRKPFRRVTDKGALLWDRIHKLEKGQIYKQGNLYEFLRLTGWRGSKVLYFGDHIYSDLADLTLKHGWRTGAIIPELRKEIKIMNTEQPQTKDIFNAQFGSLFRTYHNPTYFSRRLSRFADIYMASISCLLNYDFQHTFFPRRTPLQHESPFWPENNSANSTQLHETKAGGPGAQIAPWKQEKAK
ncbi:hypothetical protein INR49_017548 [Caranx melampygus]|nr:hypothetical protein INR49_017548 [Caranx melampygus]